MITSSKIKTITASILTSFLLVGCGGGSDSDTEALTLSSITGGQLIDSYVQNVDYECADGSTGVTDINGRFTCNTLPVTFRLGHLTLGKIDSIEQDGQVFPQNLFGLNRSETNSSEVIAMARLLQSCDEDNNSANGLNIPQSIKDNLSVDTDFSADDIDSYANITVSQDEALKHLESSTKLVESINELEKLPKEVADALLTPSNTLSQEVKNTLAYMGNEERLAYDVYNTLYTTHLATGTEIKQLTNIANKSEYTHIQTVQLLVQKYIKDVSDFTNVTLANLEYIDANIEDMPAGVYDIAAIQNLYDMLIAKGVQSKQDALEVGCMIEVVDINDLAADILLAEKSNADDVATAFEFLRDGSYSHYWSFDSGLKKMGVTDGCCVLGAEYCHPEYPQNSSGNVNTEGKQKGKR